MGAETAIAWTDSTFNPWWGCTKVDTACEHCYAETFDKRWGGSHWGPRGERRTFGEKHWREPFAWNREAAAEGQRRRVFCGSMCDWAEDHPTAAEIRPRLWTVIRETLNLDWLLLTKRADRIGRCLPVGWGDEGWRNVWQGVTVGDEPGLWRLAHLKRVPARVRFVSAEPLVAPVDFTGHLDGIHWVIVGAESGPGARPMDEDWVRRIRDQCVAARVAFFYKQRVEGGGLRKISTPVLDGQRWVEPPTGIPPVEPTGT